MTEKLFVKDVYLKEADMTLLEIKEEKGVIKAAFDCTVFYPEGGGQLADSGYIGEYKVIDVQEEANIVWHSLTAKAGTAALEVGKSYRGALDWERRFSHMQMHLGEHILSGAFYKLYGIVNKGFHMGEEYTTIDMDYPDGSNPGEITPEMAAAAERLANEAVFADLPVTTYYFDTAEEASEFPNRKPLKYKEDVSIVVVGTEGNYADCCPCCGTHPSSSGQVGLIKITHCEKYKGMNRYYVKCGMGAYEDYCNMSSYARQLGLKYSCDPADLETTLAAADRKAAETHAKYASLKGYCLRQTEHELATAFNEPCGKSIRIMSFEQYTADDLQTLLRKSESIISGPVALVADPENTVVLASPGKPDCGTIVKECAPIYHGRGGGKPNIARAIFNKKEELELFLDLVEKHLR